MEGCYDARERLCVDPRLRKRPVWRYREGAADGSLHGSAWQLSLYYALALLRLNRDLPRAGAILERVLDLQERDPADPDFGNFRHILELEHVGDRNSVFFVNFALIVARQEFPARVSPAARQAIERSLPLSMRNLLAGDAEANFSYTNANLGRLACGLLIAEALDDPEARETFSREFLESVRINEEMGIAERLSDTYYMVNILALAMIVAYSRGGEESAAALPLLDVMTRELRFFGGRQPLPARRTYNQEAGLAGKVTVLDWLLGDLAASPGDLPRVMGRRIAEEPPDETFRTHAGWAAVIEPVLRRIAPHIPDAPSAEPRAMTGKLAADSFYTSYFHSCYTLGCISDYPTLNLRHQHVSDMPAGFSGASSDLGFPGMYAIDGDGICHSHPGRFVEASPRSGAHHGMPGGGRPAVIRSAAVQLNNICAVLYDLDGLSACVREAGILVRVPQFTGSLHDGNGRRLGPGTGAFPGPWGFLSAPGFHTAVRALSHFDPVSGTVKEGGFRYELSDGHLQLFLPLLQTGEAVPVSCSSISAGLLLACHSARDVELGSFLEAVKQWTVEDRWEDDRYTYRGGPQDFIRRIRVEAAGRNLSLDYDCRLHRPLARMADGRPVACPSGLCAVVPGGAELL